MTQKKKFKGSKVCNEKTFYGIDNCGGWYLNGKYMYSWDGLIGGNKEKIREKINLDHFSEGDVLIDIYFDSMVDGGIMKIKRVGYKDGDKYEAQINNINNCKHNKKKAWIPCFVFSGYSSDNFQAVMISCVPPSYYGVEKEISWNG